MVVESGKLTCLLLKESGINESGDVEDSSSLSIIDTIPLDKETEKLANDIIKEKDTEKVKDLVNVFNLNLKKKNVLRIIKLNGLLDKVNDQAIERFEKRPDEVSNQELLKYIEVVQDSIDRTERQINSIEQTPIIAIQDNSVNINAETPRFNKQSKQHIIDAVKKLLNQIQPPKVIEGEVVDKESGNSIKKGE